MLLWCDSVLEGLRRYGFAIPLLSDCNRLRRTRFAISNRTGCLFYRSGATAQTQGVGGQKPGSEGGTGLFRVWRSARHRAQQDGPV